VRVRGKCSERSWAVRVHVPFCVCVQPPVQELQPSVGDGVKGKAAVRQGIVHRPQLLRHVHEVVAVEQRHDFP
jgi:hypothetical protein